MQKMEDPEESQRRGFFQRTMGLLVLLSGACPPVVTSRVALAKQANAEGCSVATPPAMTGPFFTPRSPRRNALIERGTNGDRMTLTGRVLGADCKPIAGALLDFWQADALGNYDNKGYRLRGHQFANEDGTYTLETVIPGEYPGRTPHLHVRVRGGSGPVLTTQLYFPGHPKNGPDFLFDERLVMKGGASKFYFDFVL